MKVITVVKEGYDMEKAAENLREAGYEVIHIFPTLRVISAVIKEPKREDALKVEGIQSVEPDENIHINF